MVSSGQRTGSLTLSVSLATWHGCECQHGHKGSWTLGRRHAPARGALRVLSAALAITKGTACIESAGKTEKAIAAKSKALEPGAHDKAGRCERPLQGGAWHGVETSPREGEREGYVRTWKKSDQVRGTHLWRPQRKGYVKERTWNEGELMGEQAGDCRGRDLSEHR